MRGNEKYYSKIRTLKINKKTINISHTKFLINSFQANFEYQVY